MVVGAMEEGVGYEFLPANNGDRWSLGSVIKTAPLEIAEESNTITHHFLTNKMRACDVRTRGIKTIHNTNQLKLHPTNHHHSHLNILHRLPPS